jgi:hypothetical protein
LEILLTVTKAVVSPKRSLRKLDNSTLSHLKRLFNYSELAIVLKIGTPQNTSLTTMKLSFNDQVCLELETQCHSANQSQSSHLAAVQNKSGHHSDFR